MCPLPIEIDGTEKIVRIVLCDKHIKKGSNQPKHQLFRSKPDTDDVSVVRHDYKGSDFCKRKGKEIAGRMRRQSYVGLAVIRATSIRQAGSSVHDSRRIYCGHAHIMHGFTCPANDPPASQINLMLTNRCNALLHATVYHPDPNPQSEHWTGPDI